MEVLAKRGGTKRSAHSGKRNGSVEVKRRRIGSAHQGTSRQTIRYNKRRKPIREAVGPLDIKKAKGLRRWQRSWINYLHLSSIKI